MKRTGLFKSITHRRSDSCLSKLKTGSVICLYVGFV